MPDLIRLIHKSSIGVNKIITVFRTHWGAKMSMNSPNPPPDLVPDKVDSTPKSTTDSALFQHYAKASGISKRQLEKTIQAIATKEARPPLNKPVWYVHDNVMKQYGLTQENLTPLVPDSLPILSPRLPDNQPSHRTPEAANQAGRTLKRKANSAGKSLLQFLSRSPLAPSPKRIKCDAQGDKQDEVIILDPPPSKTDSHIPAPQGEEVIILDSPKDSPVPRSCSATDESSALPLAKRPCLEQKTPSLETPSPAPEVLTASDSSTPQDNVLNILQAVNQVGLVFV